MKNDFINKFDNTIKIKIKGKNIERFLKRLISLEIDLLEIEYIKYNEINIKVYKKELKKIEEIKTIYDITIIDIYGIDRTKNKYIIISIIISFLFILYLSNTIFSISVIHNDSKLRDLIIEELRDNNIRVYGFKQNYKYINKVKENILKKHKDKIEWLEIENIGTKYIVRVEERKINNLKDIDKPRNLIAKKNGLIKKIIANNTFKFNQDTIEHTFQKCMICTIIFI